MKEWDNFSDENLQDLLQKLYEIFQYLAGSDETFPILSRFCSLISKILMRSHSQFFVSFMNSVIEVVGRLISSNINFQLERAYFILINSIISEYSDFFSCSVDMSVETLVKIRCEFEEKYLLELFKLSITAIVDRIIQKNLYETLPIDYCKDLLNCIETILLWHFNVSKFEFRCAWFREFDKDLLLPQTWLQTIAECNFCSLLFYLFNYFKKNLSLNGLTSSCLIRYSSLKLKSTKDGDFFTHHVNCFYQEIFKLIKTVNVDFDQITALTVCRCLRVFQENLTPFKNNHDFFKLSLQNYVFLEPDVLLLLAQTLASALLGDDSEQYQESAEDFSFYILTIREYLHKYHFLDSESEISQFQKNIALFGQFLIEKELIKPLGTLCDTAADKIKQDIDDNQTEISVDHSWVDRYGATFIHNPSVYLSEKLQKIIIEMYQCFQEKGLNAINFLNSSYYNIQKIVNIFTKSLMDEGCRCFMHLGLVSISTAPSSARKTREFVSNYISWKNSEKYGIFPDFLSRTETSVNGHVQFFISILVIWQLLIELVKVSGVKETTHAVLISITKFMDKFPLFYPNVPILNFKSGEPLVSGPLNNLKFITSTEHRSRITSIILENAFLMFKLSFDIDILNKNCTHLLIEVSKAISEFCLFDGKRTFSICKDYYDHLIATLQSVDPNPNYVKNLLSLVITSASYCRISDGCTQIFNDLSDITVAKFLFDFEQQFPITEICDQEDRLTKQWFLNFSILHGLFTFSRLPEFGRNNYPLMVGNMFEKVHKPIIYILIKNQTSKKVLIPYITIVENFVTVFNYYSSFKVDLIPHFELVDEICKCYCSLVRARIPLADPIQEDKTKYGILKVLNCFNRFCVKAVNMVYPITQNHPHSSKKEIEGKMFNIIKSILFTTLRVSDLDFTHVPKFINKVSNALSEFVFQFQSNLRTMTYDEVSLLANYIVLSIERFLPSIN